MEFESLNAAEGEGRRRWLASGKPTVPSLVLDGHAHSVLHVSQVAELLGLEAPVVASPALDGARALEILDAWLGRIRGAAWEELLEPTPSRGRTLRNLTVNVFHPFELLPDAWESGEFPWRPETDVGREVDLEDGASLCAWAESAASGWRSFLDRQDVDARDPIVTSPRGETRFSALVSSQHWHAAYHYRQLVHVLGADDGGLLEGLALPREIF